MAELGPQEQVRLVARARARSGTGRWADAAVLWQEVVAHNPHHGGYWHRLAEACDRSGDDTGAVAAYRRALELGSAEYAEPALPGDLAYRIACCQARSGRPEEALATLAHALDLGYRDLEAAHTEPDLAAVRADPRFGELVGVATPLDRDAGWRADLRLLSREVKRRAYRPFEHPRDEDDFDTALAALDRAVPEFTDHQILVEIMKLLRRLGDGHAYVDEPAADVDFGRLLPVQLFDFEEGLHIVAAPPEHRELLGARVLTVDTRPVAEVWKALDAVVARDNEYWPRRIAPSMMRQTAIPHALGVLDRPDRATLALRLPDGAEREVTLDAVTGLSPGFLLPAPAGWTSYPDTLAPPAPLYLRNPGVPFWFEHLADERLVYFQFNGVGDAAEETFERFSHRLLDAVEELAAQRLVIDLRWNGGGNTFLTLPLLHRLIGCDRINRRGRLFVVIGRGTFSAAQNFATSLDVHTNAVFVGEPSGSRPNFVGETIPFRLPHRGAQVNVSDLYWQTSWPLDHRTWIAPELYAPPTFAAYRENRDPAMEAVLAVGEHLPGW